MIWDEQHLQQELAPFHRYQTQKDRICTGWFWRLSLTCFSYGSRQKQTR